VNVANRGNGVISFVRTFSVAASDSNTSIYRLFKVNGNMVPVKISILAGGTAFGTDYDLGLYDTLEKGGAVKDKDCFLDGGSFSAAVTMSSPTNGLTAPAGQNLYKQVYEFAGDSKVTPDCEYDLALTANTAGTSASWFTVLALFAKTT
jgi:hypothetical protein